MKTLEVSRFRVVEQMLISQVGADAAEAICAAIALCADCTVADVEDLDGILIPVWALAERFGCLREDVSERLQRADAIMSSAIGIHILAAPIDAFADPQHVPLHADFVDCVRGISVGRQSTLPHRVKSDVESKVWMDLVACAAMSGSPAPFFYRCSRGRSERADEVLSIAAALSEGEAIGAVALLDPSSGRNLSLGALALSAMLTLAARVLIVTTDIVVPPRGRDEADDYFADVGEHAKHDEEVLSTVSAHGEQFLAMAAVAPVVTIIPVAEDSRFAPKSIEAIVGALGPLRHDREASVAAAKALVGWPLSDDLAARIVALYPDVTASRRILHTADRLHIGSHKPLDRNQRRQTSAAARNALAKSLLEGVAQHLGPTRSTRSPLSNEPFFDELVICDQRDLILDRSSGDKLRRAAAHIGLFGVPGTGKTQLAAAIATSVLKCEPLHIGASDILAYKLGQLEKNLRAAFRKARELGAVLVFDEFDSIGSSRAEAGSASYIVSLTNAILVEMDAHPLPIITCSNFAERIDPAIRRRYDITTVLQPIPEAIEPRAFELVLGHRDHREILGQTCISDYAHARRVATLTGNVTLAGAVEAVRKARDIRRGEFQQTKSIGFLR